MFIDKTDYRNITVNTSFIVIPAKYQTSNKQTITSHVNLLPHQRELSKKNAIERRRKEKREKKTG